MLTLECTRCKLTFDQSLFVKKNGGFYKRCINCREQNLEYVRKRNIESTNNTKMQEQILTYEELESILFDKINEIGHKEFIENCNAGIDFSCTIKVSLEDDKTPKDIANNLKDFIGKIDGYYYM